MQVLQHNPFAQPSHYWRLNFVTHAEAVGTVEESFDDIALAVSNFETDEEHGIWTVELLFECKPDTDDITRRLMLIAGMHEVTVPTFTLEKLPQQDWLSQVASSFPPLSIGRFYIHGSHIEMSDNPSQISIQVDAGAAFGSGEHGTTRCCLEAMEYLSHFRRFDHMMDMGCGSGVLAIAAAKLWRGSVLAVDIDAVAVRVTKENVRDNREHQWVRAEVSDGYDSNHVQSGGNNGQYDLVIANILARPLVSFAPALAKHLQPGGMAILSGLLSSQETMVMAAHRMQGLTLVKRFTHEGWCTLLLEKQDFIVPEAQF